MAYNLSKSRYESKVVEKPKNESTAKRWLEVYYDYATGSLTEKECAQKYGLTIQWVSKIIKWAVYHLDIDADNTIYKQILLDRFRKRTQYLDNALKRAEKKGIKEEMSVIRELRLQDKLIAQMQSVLAKESEGKGDVQVNVQINQLNRRKGDGSD